MATAKNWREKLRQAEAESTDGDGHNVKWSEPQAGSETLAKIAITAKSPPSVAAGTSQNCQKTPFGINGTFGSTPVSRQTPSRSPNVPSLDEFEERAALIEYGAGVPREWAEGFARLDLASPPAGFDPKRWRTLIDDGGKFLDRWAVQAARLGWSVLDLFGAHPVAPAYRYDAAGLVNLISGGDVVDIRTDRAVIRTPSGNSLTYYLRRDCRDAVALWDLGTPSRSPVRG
jgi:hypothetical protein